MMDFLKKFSKDLGIDLGTANTRVAMKEKGIVIDAPTVVSLNTRTGQILAVGHEAKEMIGKTPPQVTTIKPLLKGVISDFEVTEKLLKYFIDKLQTGQSGFTTHPRVVIGVPLETTEVERKAVEDAAHAAGVREVFLVEEPILGAIGARLPIEDPLGTMIVDIGAGTTEIAVISLSGVVTWKSLPVAGDEMNKAIIQYARDACNLVLGERQAEEVKIKIGSAEPLSEPVTFELRGRDMLTGLPKEVIVTDAHIRDALARHVRTITENIKATLEQTPAELAADIYERGLVLIGGTSLLRGMDKAIARATEIPVRVAEDPLTCVVRGTILLLENMTLLKNIAIPSTRDAAHAEKAML